MPVPPVPPPLESLGHRPFSFYPAIANIEHNEWRYRRATWSEVLVLNTKSSEEVWIPRRLLGEVSRVDEPVMIVGLLKELELRAGAVWPIERRIIPMPIAVNQTSVPPAQDARRSVSTGAPVVGIRLESRAESRVSRLVLGSLAVGIAGCVLLVSLYRGEIIGSRVAYSPMLQSDLEFTANDDYSALIRKLGPPERDRWRSERGELQYRALSYPRLGYSLVLMGVDRREAHYIGAVDKDWRPIHSVRLPGNVDSYSILRSLKRF
jgi:hypothetical protein